MKKTIALIALFAAVTASADNYAIIHQFAKAKWPGDATMQQYEVKEQTRAATAFDELRRVDGVPDKVVEQIKKKAAELYPDDFTMRIVSVNEQIRQYKAANPKK